MPLCLRKSVLEPLFEEGFGPEDANKAESRTPVLYDVFVKEQSRGSGRDF